MSDINEVINEVTEKMPEVQEHTIAAETDEVKTTDFITLRDRYGNSFNADRHRTDDAGKPLLNKDGTLKVKRGRRKKEQAGGFQLPGSARSPAAQTVGKQIADSIFAIGQMIGGEEWKPIVNAEYGINEYTQMVDAWTGYAEAKDLDDFPPGIAVTICCMGYIAPRMFMPKTKSRLQKAKETVYTWYGKYRARKTSAT